MSRMISQQQLSIQYLVRKQTIAHTAVRMAHLIQQNQYLPRLAKNKQLDNPYQSTTTSAGSDISRIFLLNDRRKVTFSEQSDSQQHSPPHNLSQTLSRYLTAQRQSPIDMASSECEKQKADLNSTIKHAGQVHAWDDRMGQSTSSKNQDYFNRNYDITPMQEYDPNSRSPTFNPRVHTSETPQFAATHKSGTPENNKNYSDHEQQQTHKYQYQPKYPSQPQHEYEYSSPVQNKNKNISYTNIRKSNQYRIQNVSQSNQQDIDQIRVQTIYEKKVVYNTKTHSLSGLKNSKHEQIPEIVVNQVNRWDKKQNAQSEYPKNKTTDINKNNNTYLQNNTNTKHEKQSNSEQEMEEIAEEDDTQQLVKKQVQNLNITKSIRRSNKPSLYSASRIVGMDQELNENQKRGSLIDKIKQQTFFESRVIIEDQLTRRQSVYNNQQKQYEQAMKRRDFKAEMPTRSPRKFKIFGNFDKKYDTRSPYASVVTPPKYTHGPSRVQPSQYNENYAGPQRGYGGEGMQQYNERNTRANQTISPQRYEYRQSRKEQDSRQFQRQPNFAICPHTQCILKSLEIIDKLTDKRMDGGRHTRGGIKQQQNQYSGERQRVQYSKHKSVVSQLHRIESQSLDISLQMDKLIAELTLEDLLKEQTTRRIKQMKIQIERLIDKIKQNNEQQNFIRFKQSNLSSKSPYKGDRVRFDTSRLAQNKWDLCGELQKICKTLHYIQVVQQRYKMWNMRLHHLSERVKDILNVDPSNRFRMIRDISQHASQLQSAKFYGNEASLGLIQAFNNYIDKQTIQLNNAVEWIAKNDNLSR